MGLLGPVTMCANCDCPVRRCRKTGPRLCAPMPPGRGRATLTGWDHWGLWQGVRCPGRLTGAEPGRQISEDAYWAWVDERLAARAKR